MYAPPPFKSDRAKSPAFAQARLADGKPHGLLAVHGAAAYVSADWFERTVP
jgi:predicted FMN-binding regulatory protein PaiB